MRIVQIKAKIISNQRFKEDYRHLEFASAIIAKNALPGQFVDIRVGNGIQPLLRRPISVHAVKGDKVKLFYEVVGEGTKVLSQRKPGELLDVIGPLGNGFDLGPKHKAESTTILAAGGMGVAPLIFLAEKLRQGRRQKAKGKTIVLIGAKTKAKILCSQEFKKLGCVVKLATDDGSLGSQGKVTDLLKQLLPAINYRLSTIYSCGPRAMLKAVSEIARKNKIRAQLSLEEHMACGIGACLGCVVATKTGYQRVCKDGPVFSSEELTW